MCTIGQRFIWRLNNLPSCANVPSLVLLAQKFTKSEDLTFKKLKPSCACRLCRSSLGTPPPQILSPFGGHRPTKFRSNPSTGLACSIIKIFLEVLTRRHVAGATLYQSLRDWYHRFSGASNGASTDPSRPPVPAPGAKMFKHTDTHTSTIEPTFSATRQRKSLIIILFMLKHQSHYSLRF